VPSDGDVRVPSDGDVHVPSDGDVRAGSVMSPVDTEGPDTGPGPPEA
jgi:hypothetical protein